MSWFNKKGVTPVIATISLILIAFVAVSIILLWALNFFEESAQKNGKPAEQSCKEVAFEAEIDSQNNILVLNEGNIPIFGVNLFIRGNGFDDSREILINDAGTIGAGTSKDLGNVGSIPSNSQVFASPIILTEREDTKQSYACGEEFSHQIL